MLYLSTSLYLSGQITISVTSGLSNASAPRTPVGHIIKRNNSVTITCQTLNDQTSPIFTWSKRTLGNYSTFSADNIQSWTEGEYLYGSIRLNYFDYSDCGVYKCTLVNINGTLQEAEIPVSIEGIVCILFPIV